MGRTTNSRGFTLVEMLITAVVLGMLAKLVVGASRAASDLTELGTIQSELVRQSNRAMGAIAADLRMSGFETIDGRDFPAVFDGGSGGPGFPEFSFAPAPQAAVPGDPDFGPIRSIVLCMPSDLDGDGRPELDADGDGVPELDGNGDGVPTDDPADTAGIWDSTAAVIHPRTRVVWSRDPIAYQLVQGADGRSELVRVSGPAGAEREVVARGVERIQFDTPASSGFTIPGGTCRVRVFLRIEDDDGHVFRSQHEAVVRLRNG